MTNDRWGALTICLGIALFCTGVGIRYGISGLSISIGAVLMFLGLAIIVP